MNDTAKGLPPDLAQRSRLPLIAAPMLRVSGSELVHAACEAGVVGAFPTVKVRSTEELGSWLSEFDAAAKASGDARAPHCPNVIGRHPRAASDESGPKHWADIFSAGHSVSGVTSVSAVADLVDRTATEFETARAVTLGLPR